MKTNMLNYFVLLLVLCGVVNVQASVVFRDDFENVSAVQWPNYTTDADPLAQVGVWGTITEADRVVGAPLNEGIQVSNNAVPGPVGGSNYLTLTRFSNQSIWAYMVGNFTQEVTDVMTIDFDLNVKYGDAPTGLDFGVSATDSWSWAINDRFLVYASGFRVFRTNGDELGSPRPLNAWYHIQYEIDLATDTYDLIVAGDRYEGLTFERPADKLACMYVTGYWGSTDTFYMDNVVAVVPEPATILMLSIGGLLIKLHKEKS